MRVKNPSCAFRILSSYYRQNASAVDPRLEAPEQRNRVYRLLGREGVSYALTRRACPLSRGKGEDVSKQDRSWSARSTVANQPSCISEQCFVC